MYLEGVSSSSDMVLLIITEKKKRTLVPLLLDFEFFRQVLIFLPLDRGAKSTIVHKVTRVSNLLLIEICFLENIVLEKVVVLKYKEDLEAGLAHCLGICANAFGQVFEADIDKVFKSLSVAICDDFAQTQVVSKRGKPELGDAGGGRGNILGQNGVIFVILDRSLFARIDLLSGCCGLSSDYGVSAFVEGFLEFKILRNNDQRSAQQKQKKDVYRAGDSAILI